MLEATTVGSLPPLLTSGVTSYLLLLLSMGTIFKLWNVNRATSVRYASEPPLVTVKAQKDRPKRVSLREFVETKCPALHSPFHPAWWLFNGHLQTIYCVIGDFTKKDIVSYKRTYLRLLDGGTLGLDFTPIDDANLKADTPIIVVTHGLTGGSYESYIRSILAPACAPVEQGGLGYRAVVVNFRGCAGVPITSPQMYSAGYTDDLRQALFYIANLYPNAPLLGLSFSLGANVMVRYIAEEGQQSRLMSACALGCPWDLAANNKKLLSTYIGTHVYQKGMGSNLLNLTRHHAGPLSQDPEHRVAKALQFTLALNKPTLNVFDETFTKVAGGSPPHWPFETAHDYYVYSSSHQVLGDVCVPLLAINAADDPVVQDVPVGANRNGWVVMALTPKGGHLGWFEPDGGWGQVTRWVKQPVLEWLRSMAEDLDYEHPQMKPFHEVDGFLKEVGGRDELGCKVLEGGGIVNGTQGEGMLAGL